MPREGEARERSSRGSLYASSTKAVHRWGRREVETHSSEEDVIAENFQKSDVHKRPSLKSDNSSLFIERGEGDIVTTLGRGRCKFSMNTARF